MTCTGDGLAEHERATLDAALGRIIPSDEIGPGAVEAGVGDYIHLALAGPYANVAGVYRADLAALDAWARDVHGAPFAGLDPAEQDAVLMEVEDGKATGFVPDSATFFALLREHALQGMFGDPVHGGNRGRSGWQLVGYDGPRLVVTAEEQELGTLAERP